MMRYEILRDVLIKHAPVARVVVVDRLDVALNELLVHFACHRPPPSFAVNATVIAERAEIFDSFDVAVVYAGNRPSRYEPNLGRMYLPKLPTATIPIRS